MFSFRQKIFITYLLVFLIFIAMIFPLAQRAVKDIAQKAMEDRATELITILKAAPNDEALISKIKEQKALVFFRVSVVTNERKLLYDSHTKRLLGPRFSQEFVVSHPEVLRAFREGTGYHEGYSQILSQEFAYFAKAFDFHGKTYVLRIAFPLVYVQEITKDFELGFLGSAFVILLLFSAMTWFILHYLTRPIQQIIQAVKPYQEGDTDSIPTINLKPANRSDEFGQLANTLNSLSVRIRNHILTLTLERNEKETILESLVEGVIATDNDMTITFANTAAGRFLGLNKQSLLDKTAQEVLRPEKCARLLMECQKTGTIITDTIDLKHRGKKLFLDLVAAPTKDKKGAILVLQDKTEHYRIIEMRKDFIANASHELKTPITIIRGFAETAHDNPDLPENTRGEILEKIVRNCNRMTSLIKDLLTLTDIEHIPDSRLVKCDLIPLAENAINTVQDAYSDAGIQLVAEPDKAFPLRGDSNLLELAFINLLENAAKYSPAPADITITLEQEGDEYKVMVSDKGVGIPEEDLEHIFVRFFRVDKSRAKKIGGTGLGLSIVETIIEKHFGRISVKSKLGEGTTFTIYLPADKNVKK